MQRKRKNHRKMTRFLPVLAQAHFVAECFVAQFAGKRSCKYEMSPIEYCRLKTRSWLKTNVFHYAIASNAPLVRVVLRTFFHISRMNTHRPAMECPAAWTNDDDAGDADAGRNSSGLQPLPPPMHLVHPVAETVTLNCESAANLRGRLGHRNWPH